MTNLNYHQKDSHDWLADAAEAYVRYCFAREGFEVYGAGKWAADAAIYDKELKKWWRIEIKSTDHPRRKPIRKSLTALAKKAELYSEVIFRSGIIKFTLVKLNEGKHEKYTIKDNGDIRKFLYGKAAKR